MHALQSSTVISGFLTTFAFASPHLMARNASTTENLAVKPPPVSNEGGNWTTAKCSDDVVGDPRGTPELRWSEADADNAWEAVARFWNEDSASQGATCINPSSAANTDHPCQVFHLCRLFPTSGMVLKDGIVAQWALILVVLDPVAVETALREATSILLLGG